jgi:hypothetical protein
MKNFFHQNCVQSTELFDRIAAACEGLIYVSEIDAPVMPFAASVTGEITREAILHELGRDANESVEMIDLNDLFDRLTAMKDWFGERETKRAVSYRELKDLLEASLTGLKVFRVGVVRVDIFVVGADKNGCVMGVTTTAVET